VSDDQATAQADGAEAQPPADDGGAGPRRRRRRPRRFPGDRPWILDAVGFIVDVLTSW
jgi:hypothetical protein